MTKRGRAEDDHPRREDHDLDNDDNDGDQDDKQSQGFVGADAATMATRQVFKAKRRIQAPAGTTPATSASHENESDGAFKSFAGLKPASAPASSTSGLFSSFATTSGAASKTPSPLLGTNSSGSSGKIQFGAPSSTTSVFGGFGASADKKQPESTVKSPFSFGSSSPQPFPTLASSTSTATDKSEDKSTFVADLAALNKSFCAWIERQGQRTGVLDYSDGCKQYLKYRDELKSSASTSTAAPAAAAPLTITPSPAAPSFTLASVVQPADTSYFTKAGNMPFAPKIPSPLSTEALTKPNSAPAATNTPEPEETDGNDDEEPAPDEMPKPFEDDDMNLRKGEEDEKVLFSKRCKLFKGEKDESGKMAFKTMGLGEVRLLEFVKGDSIGKFRLIVREESALQKILLNTFLFPALQPKLIGKRVQLLVPITTSELVQYLVALKTPEDGNALIDLINKHKPKD